MSDDSYSREEINTDIGSFSVDDEDQLGAAEDILEDRGVEDALDEGYVTQEKPIGVNKWGTTAWEQEHRETIDQRIEQEIPDPNTAYGAPDNESGLDAPEEDLVGGDDPDAIPAEQDFLGGEGARSGRLVAPDEGAHEDREGELLASDVGISGGAASAEEAAMHIVSDDLVEDDLGADDEADELAGLDEGLASVIEREDPSNEPDSIRRVD